MQKYIAQYGTSYRLANYFFPQEIKDAVIVLYAFVRVPDNVVDSPDLSLEEKENLFAHQESMMWSIFADKPVAALRAGDAEWIKICSAMHVVKNQYQIPHDWIQSFFDAMRQDLTKNLYENYAEVQEYMYGSAEVVGLMMTKIIGYDGTKEGEVLRTACLLGEAMQYTNFLRDVLEDFVVHGRIYMPADRLKQFGLTTTHVEELCQGDMSSLARWQVFIQDQIACCRLLYQEANSGIALLHPDGRKAVRYASRLYESILTKIEKRAGNVFSANVRTTKFEKLKTLFTSWLQSPF